MPNPGFVVDCPRHVYCRGFTACLLYVSPRFGNQVLTTIKLYFCKMVVSIYVTYIHLISIDI